jgi:hypothetical protein
MKARHIHYDKRTGNGKRAGQIPRCRSQASMHTTAHVRSKRGQCARLAAGEGSDILAANKRTGKFQRRRKRRSSCSKGSVRVRKSKRETDRRWKADALSRRRRDASCVCARAGAQAPCTHGGRRVSGGCQGSGVKERQRASSVVGQTKEQGSRCAGVRKLSQRGLGGWLGSDGAHVGEEPGKLALRARGGARAVGLRAANVGLRKRRRGACAVPRSRRSGHGDGHGRQRALPRAHAPVVAGRLPLACAAHGAHGLS